MYFPSGESCAAAISGLPKNSSRSRRGGAWKAEAGAGPASATAKEKTANEDTDFNILFIGAPAMLRMTTTLRPGVVERQGVGESAVRPCP